MCGRSEAMDCAAREPRALTVPVIDSDQHLYETRTMWLDHIDPAHRDDVIAILAKHTRATAQIAAATYDLYVNQQVIARAAGLFEDGIKANFDALVAIGDLAEPPPLTGFIDASFLAQASKQ